MNDLTFIFNLYRECACNLWNMYFLKQPLLRVTWDVVDDFDNICTQLFLTLVLDPVGRQSEKKQPMYKYPLSPLMSFRVIPLLEGGVPLRINRDVPPKGYWDYPFEMIKPSDADLRFIDYFDFDRLGSCHFQYCRVRIVSSERYPELIGRDALLENDKMKIMLVD